VKTFFSEPVLAFGVGPKLRHLLGDGLKLDAATVINGRGRTGSGSYPAGVHENREKYRLNQPGRHSYFISCAGRSLKMTRARRNWDAWVPPSPDFMVAHECGFRQQASKVARCGANGEPANPIYADTAGASTFTVAPAGGKAYHGGG
jgi:hypothetical protein